jgi:hypothetical protein
MIQTILHVAKQLLNRPTTGRALDSRTIRIEYNKRLDLILSPVTIDH